MMCPGSSTAHGTRSGTLKLYANLFQSNPPDRSKEIGVIGWLDPMVRPRNGPRRERCQGGTAMGVFSYR